MSIPFARFRVYPDKKRYYYFDVYVFGNKRDMIEAVNSTGHPTRQPMKTKRGEYNAITLPWIKRKSNGKRPLRDLGQIVFYRLRCGVGTVSHEMTHAATHYLRAVKGHKVIREGKGEEMLATTVGDLTRQFCNRY